MIATGVSLIICVVYSELIKYNNEKHKLEFLKWDIKTCTTSDYSVRLNFTPEWYAEYKKTKKKKSDIILTLKRAILEDLKKLEPAFE